MRIIKLLLMEVVFPALFCFVVPFVSALIFRNIQKKTYKTFCVVWSLAVWLLFLIPQTVQNYHSGNDDSGGSSVLPVVVLFGWLSYKVGLNIMEKRNANTSPKQKFQGNKARVLNACSELIDEYESTSYPSCKNDVIQILSNTLDNARQELSNWKDSQINIPKIAHTLLARCSFDLLASGRYHMYRGTLDPMSCANNLQRVYDAAMMYAVRNGAITEAQNEDQHEYLNECIREIG